jgi:hypothetical protein
MIFKELDKEIMKRSIEAIERLSNKYPDLTRILKNLLLERPEARVTYMRISGYTTIDLHEDHLSLHGSSIAFKCNERCDLEGDIVTSLVSEEYIEMYRKTLEEYSCKIKDIHFHEAPFNAAHIHIKCDMDVKKLEEFIDKFFKYM